MDKEGVAKTYKLGDRSTSDIIVRLRNREGRHEWFHCHSFILREKSKFFSGQLLNLESTNCIEVRCSESNYDFHVKLLKLLYLSADSVAESWDSVRTALGVLQSAISLHCEEITQSCIQYLEAVPWEDKEEEEIVKAVSGLGSVAMPILARVQPVGVDATKSVFLSAIRFATSTNESSSLPYPNELKTSAQEQIEYMLVEDEDAPLVIADEEVKSEVKIGLSAMFAAFTKIMDSLPSESEISPEAAENKILQGLSDLEWMCNILTKMDLMKVFVSNWLDVSNHVLAVIQDKKLDSIMWGVKAKLIEVTGKVLDAVSYGNVILPSPSRVHLLKVWLPYIRKMKPLLDSKGNDETGFPHKMDEDLCQSIEGAMVSLVLALPSNDQAEILSEWMQSEQEEEEEERKREEEEEEEEENGEAVRTDCSPTRSEQEHRVVHVPRCMDYIHLDRLLRMAHGVVCLRLHPWYGLDHRQSLPFHHNLSFLPLEERNSIC